MTRIDTTENALEAAHRTDMRAFLKMQRGERYRPGVVCQIPEDRLRAGLEALKAQPGISLESRADLDQVRLTDSTPDYEWMERYYKGRG